MKQAFLQKKCSYFTRAEASGASGTSGTSGASGTSGTKNHIYYYDLKKTIVVYPYFATYRGYKGLPLHCFFLNIIFYIHSLFRLFHLIKSIIKQRFFSGTRGGTRGGTKNLTTLTLRL